MAFVLRRPFALTSAIKQIPKSSTPLRALHTTSKTSVNSNFKSASPITAFAKARDAFRRTPASSRFYNSPAIPTNTGSLAQRLLYGAAIVGGTVVATNAIFNRETREDGGMAPYERSFLNDTFMHTGLGIGMIGIAAQALHKSGWSFKLMSMNPWLVVGVGLAGSIGSMIATRATDPSKYARASPFVHPLSHINLAVTVTSKNTPSGPPSTSPKQPSSAR